MPVYLDGVGTTKALNTVTVRPQVDGKLISVQYREGMDVKRGDVLARIDPVTYQAQYDQAVAKKAQDEATLANAKIDLERYMNLAATNSSRASNSTRKGRWSLKPKHREDRSGDHRQRQSLRLYTITAPIDGRTGIRQVDEGNIVHASDATGIVALLKFDRCRSFYPAAATGRRQQSHRCKQSQCKGPLTVDALGATTRR